MKPRCSLVVCLFKCLFLATTIEARKSHEIRPGRFQDVDRFDEVFMIVRNTFLMACAPVVLSFLYSIYKDPATPIIIKALGRRLKRRLLGNLSTRKNRKY